MARKKQKQTISTSEFASSAGIEVSVVTRLIRQKKIEAVKEAGKWMIPQSQLKLKVIKEISVSNKKSTAKKTKKAPAKAKKTETARKKTPAKAKKALVKAKKAAAPQKGTPEKAKKAPTAVKETLPVKAKETPPRTKKTYSVSEFSEMTYLTVNGVNKWLKEGKLNGEKDETGQWRVDAASLKLPNMKSLIR